MPGIALVAYGAETVVAKEMPIDTIRFMKKVDSMTASTILLLFQSAYVLRMKIHSENMADTAVRPVTILFNARHSW